MLCGWGHGDDPGRVSDGSRLALDKKTISIECPPFIFSLHVLCDVVPFFLSLFCFVFMLSLELCTTTTVHDDVPPIFFCPTDNVSEWQQRICYLGMGEA